MARRGDRLLFAPRRRRRPGCLMVFILLILVLSLGFGLNMVNNRHVSLLRQDVTVLQLDKEIEGFPILHLSDLHAARFGEAQERIRELLRLESYKAVCLTGDMVGLSGDVQPLIDLIKVFPADVPVFLIAGDNDPPPLSAEAWGPSPKADYILRAEEAGAIYLDSPQAIPFKNRTLWFAPASLYLTDLNAAAFSLNERRAELLAGAAPAGGDAAGSLRLIDYQLDVLKRSEEARVLMDPKDAYVLLSHFPLDAESVFSLHQGEAERRQAVNFPGTVSLLLCGHWNNGQWRLPLLGPVWVPAASEGLRGWLPDDQAISGLVTVHAVPQYISPGLGTSGAYPYQPFRLYNRPQMTLIRLTSKLSF